MKNKIVSYLMENIVWVVIILVLLILNIMHYHNCLQYCENTYSGTIHKVVKPQGRSSQYFFVVDWDKESVGRQTIGLSMTEGETYKDGDRYEIKPPFNWIFGVSGTAYLPDDPDYNVDFGFLCIVHIISMCVVFACIIVIPITKSMEL